MLEEGGDEVAQESLSVRGCAAEMPVFHVAAGHGGGCWGVAKKRVEVMDGGFTEGRIEKGPRRRSEIRTNCRCCCSFQWRPQNIENQNLPANPCPSASHFLSFRKLRLSQSTITSTSTLYHLLVAATSNLTLDLLLP